MKKNLFSWGVMGMFAMLCACNSAPKGYTVSGTLPDSTMNGQTLYILNVDNSECVDSTVVEGNAYLFEGHVDTALVAGISTNGRNSLFVFALENGRITITDNGDSKGTPLNDELTRVSASLDSINTAYYKAYEVFEGTKEEWEQIVPKIDAGGGGNDKLLEAKVYFYSETEAEGDYWRYDNGEPRCW